MCAYRGINFNKKYFNGRQYLQERRRSRKINVMILSLWKRNQFYHCKMVFSSVVVKGTFAKCQCIFPLQPTCLPTIWYLNEDHMLQKYTFVFKWILHTCLVLQNNRVLNIYSYHTLNMRVWKENVPTIIAKISLPTHVISFIFDFNNFHI